MAERVSSDERALTEQLVYAGLGLLALTAERADRLADELAGLAGVRREEARGAIQELGGRVRGDRVRLTEGARQTLGSLFRELGLVTRETWDDLELRVAQLEHRLRLLEAQPGAEQADLRPRRGR